ncbi:hypothetical protein [Microcoleus sp. OTE_8_concoct_300]|uniref:hypothetical protein n=1 Tax=Microcoleus sp. OTE_8_concoct_300 TaxID=2964710 RepID=UPI00403F948A
MLISDAADSYSVVRAWGNAGEAVLTFSVFNFFSIAPSLALLVMFLAFSPGMNALIFLVFITLLLSWV